MSPDDALPLDERSYRRRTVLRTGTALASLGAVGALAGCQDAPIIGDGGAGAVLDDVPAGSRFVLHARLGAILEDDQLRETGNSLLRGDDVPAEAATVAELLDEAEQEFGLDPREVGPLTLFGSTPTAPGEADAGAIMASDWSDDELESLIGQRSGMGQPDSYEGTPVFTFPRAPRLWIALPGDGGLIVGPEAVTREVLDLRAGGGDAVGGDLSEAFTATSDGYVRFAATDPTEQVPLDGMTPDMRAIIGSVRSLRGSVASTGDRHLAVTVKLTDADAASSLEDRLTQALSLAREQAQGTDTGLPPALEQLAGDTLADTTISRSGAAVTVTAPNGLEVVVLGLLGSLASFTLGLGGQRDSTPTAAFDFDYEGGARALQVTHTGGESIRAAALSLHGRGFAGAPVGWREAGGSANGDLDGDPGIVAGDRLTLQDVSAKYEVQVVWRAPAGDSSAVMAEDEGPAA